LSVPLLRRPERRPYQPRTKLPAPGVRGRRTDPRLLDSNVTHPPGNRAEVTCSLPRPTADTCCRGRTIGLRAQGAPRTPAVVGRRAREAKGIIRHGHLRKAAILPLPTSRQDLPFTRELQRPESVHRPILRRRNPIPAPKTQNDIKSGRVALGPVQRRIPSLPTSSQDLRLPKRFQRIKQSNGAIMYHRNPYLASSWEGFVPFQQHVLLLPTLTQDLPFARKPQRPEPVSPSCSSSRGSSPGARETGQHQVGKSCLV